MKEIFSAEFFSRLAIEVILLGVLVFFIQKHFENKWAPMTAAEILKKENFLNGKRDTYFTAIDVLNRALANTNFTINGLPVDTTNRRRGADYPNEIEVNSVIAKLWLYADDKAIPLTFQEAFRTSADVSPVNQAIEFMTLIRKDLGDDQAIIEKEGYKYIQIQRKQ